MKHSYLDLLFAHSFSAYVNNFRLISFFSVPFLLSLIVFSLAFPLPNFVSLGGIFLRFGSVQHDLAPLDFAVTAVAFLVSLFLFSFALAAVNVVIRSQRTLNKITEYEVQRVETATFKLFLLLLAAFLSILVFNLLVADVQVSSAGKQVPIGPLLGSLFAFIVSLAVLFAPQAVAVDDVQIQHAVSASFRTIKHQFPLFLFFMAFASLVLILNAWAFQLLGFSLSRLLSTAVNGMIILPFLEVFKTQIYLSKYSLL